MVGSTHVVSFSSCSSPTQGHSGSVCDSSVRRTSASCLSLNPEPARPAYVSAPFTYSASCSAPKPPREPLGAVKPTTT